MFITVPVMAVGENTTIVASGICGEDATWSLDSEGVLIIDGTGRIDDCIAYQEYSNDIKSVIMEDGITSMVMNAFRNCKNLTSVKLSENLTEISYGAFFGCKNLSGEVVIPDSVEIIERNAFYNCGNVESLVLGKGLKEIDGPSGQEPFGWMSSVRKVTFRGNVVPEDMVGGRIFASMNDLEAVYVPAEVYGAYAEKYRNYIRDAKILVDSPEEMVIYEGVLVLYNGSETEVKIPDTVEAIGSFAFFNKRDKIEKIELGSNTKIIQPYSFEECSNLKNVLFNDALEQLGDSAFKNCDAITQIVLSNVTMSGEKVFYDCDKLDTVVLGNLRNIGKGMFYDCDMLSQVDIGKATIIGESAFEGCKNLPAMFPLDNVTRIGYRAFRDCCGMIGELVIPDSVTEINAYAFQNCSNIESITIGKGLKEIDGYSHDFPFVGMAGVKTITFQSDIVPPFHVSNIFETMGELETIYIPSKGVKDYFW